MSNEQNLVSFKTRTPEEMAQIAREGAKKSVEVRKRIKTLKERLKILLQIKDKEGATNHERACLALIEKAVAGDTKAFEVIRDTIGEKPIDKVSNRLGTAKNAGLKVILLGEESAKTKRDSDKS